MNKAHRRAMRLSVVCLSLVLSAVAPASRSAGQPINQIQNSSFEGGIDSRFCIGRWYLDGVPGIDLDPATRVHGRYSAKIPFSFLFGRIKPLKYTGISFRSCVPVAVTAGRNYYFSVYLKSDALHDAVLNLTPNDAGSSAGRPMAAKSISVGTDWRRYAVRFTADETREMYWEIKVDSGIPGFLWVDALQFYEDRQIADYRPAADIEAGLAADRTDKIYPPGRPVDITLRAYNDSKTPVSSQVFRIEVHDIDGRLVYNERLNVMIPAQDGIERVLGVPVGKAGVYKAVLFGGEEGKQRESVLNFSVLPLARNVRMQDSAFGIYLTLAPRALDTMRRVGFSWIANLTVNNHVNNWRHVEKERGAFVWYDDDIASAMNRGYGFMFNLEPYLPPRWARDLSRKEQLAKWSEYVSAMVGHYKQQVKFWTISDEVETPVRGPRPVAAGKQNFWTSAKDYSEWHQAGFHAIRSADKEAKVILNSSHDVARNVLRMLPPGQVDILATNSYHLPYRVKQMKTLADEFRIPEVWAPGIAVVSRPYYEEHLPQRIRQQIAPDYWRDRVRDLAIDVVETFAAGATRLFHYTGTHVGNTDVYSLFEADSGLKPVGTQFGALIWLLDGFRSVREVSTTAIEKPVRIYRFERRDGQVVFPVYREPAVESMRIRSDAFKGLPGQEPIVYDHFANRIGRERPPDGPELRVGRYPVFIMTPASRADEVERHLRNLSVSLDTLPRAKTAQVAGRYARLTVIEDKGRYRPKPNISLWYKSDANGWLEILRSRVSGFEPSYTATESGFLIEWNFTRSVSPFILEPGAFPADLVHQADYSVSRSRGSALEWRRGTIEVHTGQLKTITSAAPPGYGFKHPLNYVIRSKNALTLTAETVLEGDATRFGGQDESFGGWSLLTRNGNECFLHQYYAAGSPGPMRIRMKLSVTEAHGKSNAGQ